MEQTLNIVYSPTNLESIAVALYKKEEALTASEEYKPVLVPYDRTQEFTAPQGTWSVICGVELYKDHLADLVKSTSRTTVIFAPENMYAGTKFDKELVRHLTLVEGGEDEYVYWVEEAILLDKMGVEEVEFYQSLRQYQNFEILSIKKLTNIFLNESRMRDSLVKDTPFTFLPSNDHDKDMYFRNLAMIRGMITRGMESQYYGDHSRGLMLQTVAIPFPFAQESMRQISYPFDYFVTYEDVKGCRLWRIFARRSTDAERITKHFNIIDSWTEGFVTFLVTSIPKAK